MNSQGNDIIKWYEKSMDILKFQMLTIRHHSDILGLSNIQNRLYTSLWENALWNTKDLPFKELFNYLIDIDDVQGDLPIRPEEFEPILRALENKELLSLVKEENLPKSNSYCSYYIKLTIPPIY